MPWKKMLGYVSGSLDQALLNQNQYLIAENQTMKGQLHGRIRLSDEERRSLAEKAVVLGKLLHETVTIVKPETVLRWHKELVAKKFDYSDRRGKHGRPPIKPENEQLVVTIAKENPRWGYGRIVGTLKHLKVKLCKQTVANILKKNGIVPAPERKRDTTWHDFIRQHKEGLWACDFFTTEVWTMIGLQTFYVFFFIHISTRRIELGGITTSPHKEWMAQVARNVTGLDGELSAAKYLLRDRDGKFAPVFDDILEEAGIEPIKLPPFSPNLNAFAERFVLSMKSECLDRMILFGEKMLRHVVKEYSAHYHAERPHQGLDNLVPFPEAPSSGTGNVAKKERLGGLLKFYLREAA